VTFTPERTDGDDTAVAITSQAIDVEVTGWVQVSWEAAAGTELTAIEVLRPDGTRTTLETSDTGTVSDVLSLTFCGTVDASSGASGSTAGSADATDGADEGSSEERSTDAAPTETGDATTGGDSAEATNAGEPDRTDTQPDEVAVTDTRAEQPATTVTTVSAPATGAGASTTADGEVEVLGVQIVAPPRHEVAADEAADDGADTEPAVPLAAAPRLADAAGEPGGMHPLLLAAAVAAGLIAGVTVLRGPGRMRATPATTTSTAAGDAGATASTPGGPA
jgi:hypothetical protein